jgi:hypothetical protein
MATVIFNGKTYKPKTVNGTAYGDPSDEWFAGLGGNNEIYTNEGNNVVLAGVTFDRVIGVSPLQRLVVKPIANAGNNTIYAGSGNDYVVTGSGNDVVYLNEGNNTYDGLAGGSDTIFAGSGNDRFDVKVTGTTTIFAGEGRNVINAIGSTGRFNAFMGSGNDQVDLKFNGVSFDVNLGEGNNKATINLASRTSLNKITAGSGHDTIAGNGWGGPSGPGMLEIDAGNGNNTIDIFQPGDVSIKTGGGKDRIKIRGGNFVSIDSGEGDDDISASSIGYSTQANAGGGNNRINVVNQSGGGAYVTAGSGNDLIVALGSRAVEINAGDGNNQIIFSSFRSPRPGYDVVNAGSGNDVVYQFGETVAQINVGEGNNYVAVSPYSSALTTITAGRGWDTFDLGAAGKALITNFNHGDKIILADKTNLSVTNGSSGVEVYQGGTLRAIVENANVGLVQSSIFAGGSRPFSSALGQLYQENLALR